MMDPSVEKAECFLNPGVVRAGSYPYASRLGGTAAAEARHEISRWPGYAPMPLHTLPGLAASLDVAQLYYKDEGTRFGLGSFKALGGGYAVCRVLQDILHAETGEHYSAAQLVAAEGALRERLKRITVTAATDGNHGRAVAWGAQRFGCAAVIYLHAGVSDYREAAITAYGASIVRTHGNYDDSVRASASDAQLYGRHVISDTSYPGYVEIPRHVMHGYTLLVDEALAQMGSSPPTHVFVQGGVGGLAAAVCATLWERYGARRPQLVVVEPAQAACLMASARAGQPVAITGALDTVMAGLACGEVSLLAWDILREGADAFLCVADVAALAAMRRLADAPFGDTPIVAGESAVAGLAGLTAVAEKKAWRQALGLDPQSRVLLIGTEADTDPVLYERIVGRTGASVRAK